MSNTHQRDFKTSTRFSSGRPSGFTDDKAHNDSNEPKLSQKASDPNTPAGQQSSYMPRFKGTNFQSNHHDSATNNHGDVSDMRAEAKAKSNPNFDKVVEQGKDRRSRDRYRDGSGKGESSASQPRYSHVNGSQAQSVNFGHFKSDQHDLKSFSGQRSPSRQQSRYNDGNTWKQDYSQVNRGSQLAQQKDRREGEVKDTFSQGKSIPNKKESRSSHFIAPEEVGHSRERGSSINQTHSERKQGSQYQTEPCNHQSARSKTQNSSHDQSKDEIAGSYDIQPKVVSSLIKFEMKRLYLSSKSRHLSTIEEEALAQRYFMSVEKFLDISKVLLNKFVDLQLHLKQEFIGLLTKNQTKLQELLENSEQKFAEETFQLFALVLKVSMQGYSCYSDFEVAKNLNTQAQGDKNVEMKDESKQEPEKVAFNISSMRHCLKRIHKSCQIQIEDFLWKNGQFSDRNTKKTVETDVTKELVKLQTQLLQELIQIEQGCKLYIELYKRNFIQLFELCKGEVIHLFAQEGKRNPFTTIFSRFNSYNDLPDLLKPKKDDPCKPIDICLLDCFTGKELKVMDSSSLQLISLLEIGNTIDGVTIACKTLSDIKDKHSLPPTFASNFSKFFNWKKRRCHCCLEYILDAGKAVTCQNLTAKTNPCMNVYCQNCIIAFMEERHNFEEQNEAKEDTQDKKKKSTSNPEESDKKLAEEKKKTEEMEKRKIRRKLWLKASQNIMFTCPCCQKFCLEEEKQKKTFSCNSMCNFLYKLEHHPLSFIKKDIYLYYKNGTKKLFYLSKIIASVKQKGLHKVEILQKSQSVLLKLSKEEFFFTNTVKPESKLFKIIDQQGFELDFKKQMDKYIRDFLDHKTCPLLEKYKNYLESQDVNKNEFVIPKFAMTQQNIRKAFIEKHRDLFRRSDASILDKIELQCEDILAGVVSESESDHDMKDETVVTKQVVNQKQEDTQTPQNASVKEKKKQIQQTETQPKKDEVKEEKEEEKSSKAIDKTNAQIVNVKQALQKTQPKQQPPQTAPPKVFEKTFLIEKAQYNEEPKRPLSIDEPFQTPVQSVVQTPPDSIVQDRKDVAQKKAISVQKEGVPLKSEMKTSKQVSISNLSNDEINKFEINKRIFRQIIPNYCPPGENIGNLIVREKNIMLAKEHQVEYGDKFHLLITKEVFTIERVLTRIQLPFHQTYIFSNIPNDSLSYKWPFTIEERSEGNVNIQREIPSEQRERTVAFRVKEIHLSDDSGVYSQDHFASSQPSYKTLEMKPMTPEQRAAALSLLQKEKPPLKVEQQLAQESHDEPENQHSNEAKQPKPKSESPTPSFQQQSPTQSLKPQNNQEQINQQNNQIMEDQCEKQEAEKQEENQQQQDEEMKEEDNQLEEIDQDAQDKKTTNPPSEKDEEEQPYIEEEPQKSQKSQEQKGEDEKKDEDVINTQQETTKHPLFEEDEAYYKYLKDLESKKEYNLRKTPQIRTSLNEKNLQKIHGQKGQIQHLTDAGFYDDFPPEIIKQYGLKTSNNKVKDPIYKKQKTSESSEIKKPSQENQANNSDPPRKRELKQEAAANQKQAASEEKECNANAQAEAQELQKQAKELASMTNQSGQNSGNQNDSSKKEVKASSDKQKTDPFNFKHFVIDSSLLEHYEHIKKIVEVTPMKLQGIFIFIKKEQNWERVLLKEFIQPTSPEESMDQRMYNVVFQGRQCTNGQLNLLKWMFTIDCRYGDEKTNGESSQQQKYNDKVIVKKLLKKRTENDQVDNKNKEQLQSSDKAKVQATTVEMQQAQPQAIEKEKQTEVLSNKEQEAPLPSIEKVEATLSQQQVQVAEKLPKTQLETMQSVSFELNICQNILEQPALPQIEKIEAIKVEQETITPTIPPVIQPKAIPQQQEPKIPLNIKPELKYEKKEVNHEQTTIQHNPEPKHEWVRHMRTEILTKSRDNIKHNVKFYHQDINEADFSSADEHDQKPIKANQESNKGKAVKEAEIQSTLSQEFMKMQDQQQLNLQIRTQQFLQLQQDLLNQSNFMQQNKVPNQFIQNQELAQQQIDQNRFILLQKFENENFLIEKKKNQLLIEIQNLKFMLSKDKMNQRLIKQMEDYQNQLQQLHYTQQILQQIYRYQTQPMINPNLLNQEFLAFQQQQSGFIQQQPEHQVVDPISEQRLYEQIEMKPPQQFQPDESQKKQMSRQINSQVGDFFNSYQRDTLQFQQPIMRSEQHQPNQAMHPTFPIDQQEAFQNTYDHQSELLNINEQNIDQNKALNRNFAGNQQQLFYYYSVPGDQQMNMPDGQHIMNFHGGKNLEGMEIDQEGVNLVDNEEDGDDQYEEYLSQLQSILNKIENLESNWEVILNDSNTFKIIEKGIQLLEMGYHHERIVQDEIVRQMGIQEHMPEVDITDQEVDLGFILASDDQFIDHAMTENQEIPDFFLHHIQQVQNLRKTVGISENIHGHHYTEQEAMNQYKIQNLSKQRLYGIMMKFYQKMIVQKGFKKCQCEVCSKQRYPMLIRFNAESREYHQSHYIIFEQNIRLIQQRDASQPLSVSVLLQMMLTEQKTEGELLRDLEYAQMKHEKQLNRPNPEMEEYMERMPFFKALVEKSLRETAKQSEIEESSNNEDTKLPNISKVLQVEKSMKHDGSISPNPKIRAFKNTHRNLRENIKRFLEYYNIYRK